jgi:hypothetical protein
MKWCGLRCGAEWGNTEVFALCELTEAAVVWERRWEYMEMKNMVRLTGWVGGTREKKRYRKNRR